MIEQRRFKVQLVPVILGLLPILFVILSQSALAHGMSEADRQAVLSDGIFGFIKLGAMHMLTGYDHLLFLFGVIFFLTRFKDILHFITAFTLGHCITLVFATFFGIQANYYAIDAAIALTVCYKAFENLDGFKKYLKLSPPSLTVMVFGFGLLHGFGLSTRLQEILEDMSQEGLLAKILMFNVGVEVGQVLALTGMWLVLRQWRQRASFKQFSTVSNCLLFGLGIALFLLQVYGYSKARGLI
jgi:HupE / UreJ protein